MKTLLTGRRTLVLLAFILIGNIAFAQKDSVKAAQKWVKSKTWNNGIKLNVFSDVNAVEFKKQYEGNKGVWDKVFQFIKTHDLDTMALGKYPIAGDQAFATVSNNALKEEDQTKWESHRNYIDLQYIIKGKERIGMAPVATATVVKPYDPAKDVANYTSDGKYYVAEPGTFYLFFPPDAHRPNGKVGSEDSTKKLVIKIHVAQ